MPEQGDQDDLQREDGQDIRLRVSVPRRCNVRRAASRSRPQKSGREPTERDLVTSSGMLPGGRAGPSPTEADAPA